MNQYRKLVQRLELIENQDMLLEAGLRLKNIIQQIAGKETDDNARFATLGQLATQNSLTGLYDPVTGQFVKADGSTTNTADKETDKKLAYMGLIPTSAATSSYWGKVFGTSGDKYDADLRSQSGAVVAQQDKEDKQLEMLKELSGLIAEYMELAKKREARRAANGSTATAPSPAAEPNIAKPAPAVPGNTDPTKGKVDYSLTGGKEEPGAPGIKLKEGSMYSSLVESFGYEIEANEDVAGTALKTGGKMLGKALPFAGAAFGAADAYDRAKEGDWLGAGMAGLSGLASFVPGPGTALALGLDAANIGRDAAKGKFSGGQAQAAMPATGGDAKIAQLQKIIGATPDGKYGPETKQKLQAWQTKNGLQADGMPGPMTYAKAGIKEGTQVKQQTVAEGIASLRDRLAMIESQVDEEYTLGEDGNVYDSLGEQVTDEGILSNIWQGAKQFGKGIGFGAKNPATVDAIKSVKAGNVPGYAGAKIGAGVAKAPVKSALGAAALGGTLGYGMGGDGSSAAAVKPPRTPGAPGAPTAPTAPSTNPADAEEAKQREAEDKEMAELKAKIDAMMGQLSASKSPEVQKGLADIKTTWK